MIAVWLTSEAFRWQCVQALLSIRAVLTGLHQSRMRCVYRLRLRLKVIQQLPYSSEHSPAAALCPSESWTAKCHLRSNSRVVGVQHSQLRHPRLRSNHSQRVGAPTHLSAPARLATL